MIHEILYLISVILIILFYNKIYFYLFKEKVIFFKFLKGFVYYTIFLCIIFYYANSFIYLEIEKNFFQSLIFSYILIFLVIFFNISTKSYESPTVIIHSIIKNNGATYNQILKKLKKKKLVEIRIEDLVNQQIIFKKKNIIKATSLGIKFSKFYNFLRNFFKIKCKG